MHNTTINFIKKDGQLVPASDGDAAKFKLYSKSVKEGDVIETYMSLSTPHDKTLGQLAKVHALVRELANFTGHTFDEMKDEIKRNAGLYTLVGTSSGEIQFKSFAECSKDEISRAIETCIEIGHNIGCNIY